MKKKDQAPQAGSRTQKNPRRLTLNRETIRGLSDPVLAAVLGDALARHTFTQANNGDGGAQGDTFCG